MPPKKDAAVAADDGTIQGFDKKETKILAAAFVSSTDIGKIDFKIMGHLTGNTAGTIAKYWPAVKRKAADAYPSFAKMAGLAADSDGTPAPVKGAGRKRKAAAAEDDEGAETEDNINADADAEPSDEQKKKPVKAKAKAKGKAESKTKTKAAKGRGRPAKKAKASEADEESVKDDEASEPED